MKDLDIRVDGSRILAVTEAETLELRDLATVARLVRDRSPELTRDEARLLGTVAAVLASLDGSVVWRGDFSSIGKLLDAYDFATGSPEASAAFGEGVVDAVRDLNVLGHTPRPSEVARLVMLPR